MALSLAMLIQAGLPISTFASMADVVEQVTWEHRVGNSIVVREPVGVVGAITPWNYPLHQIAAKVAPALAAGCTVVLKPSEVAPLNAFLLADVIHEVGLPNGVFNLVSGSGPVVGEAFNTLAWLVASQMIALHAGRARFVESDAPRGLAKAMV
jgi:acyl-CoA reductase-like NAD-dependent aldehyde dehydrogenase